MAFSDFTINNTRYVVVIVKERLSVQEWAKNCVQEVQHYDHLIIQFVLVFYYFVKLSVNYIALCSI